MATTTPRAALIKPDGPEDVDVDDLNLNADKTDKFLGCILVNDGVVPGTSDLLDGILVKERTSGKIWEARKNGGGTFDPVWVRYPYLYRAFTNFTAVASSTTLGDFGANTYINGKNSSAAEKNGANFWVCPIRGIYDIRVRARWAANATGQRAIVQKLNGVITSNESEFVVSAQGGGFFTSADTFDRRVLAVGDVIGSQTWQNSGAPLGTWIQYDIEMIDPVQ